MVRYYWWTFALFFDNKDELEAAMMIFELGMKFCIDVILGFFMRFFAVVFLLVILFNFLDELIHTIFQAIGASSGQFDIFVCFVFSKWDLFVFLLIFLLFF